MADICDRGSEQAEYLLDVALHQHRQRSAGNVHAASAEFCDMCGTDIPEARRVAVPGCQHCVECQGAIERRGRVNV